MFTWCRQVSCKVTIRRLEPVQEVGVNVRGEALLHTGHILITLHAMGAGGWVGEGDDALRIIEQFLCILVHFLQCRHHDFVLGEGKEIIRGYATNSSPIGSQDDKDEHRE